MGDRMIPAEFIQQGHTFNTELGHRCSGFIQKPGMDNTGVASGLFQTEAVIFFQENNVPTMAIPNTPPPIIAIEILSVI
jgi:hypothetical protein